MNFDFYNTWNEPDSFRAQSVVGSFTLNDVKLQKHFKGSLPIEEDDWQIGIIVGRSGSGKSSIAKKLFPKEYITRFKYRGKCILDDFPKELSTSEITRMLCSVGFASPPDWLKAYSCLSQGEKMRVDVARALCLPQKRIVFDEFTSVIDREVAKIGSYAISKAVRAQSGKQFIAVTCHFDVIDWLEVDWVFNTDTMEFFKKKEPTQQLSSRCSGATTLCGKVFGNITI